MKVVCITLLVALASSKSFLEPEKAAAPAKEVVAPVKPDYIGKEVLIPVKAEAVAPLKEQERKVGAALENLSSEEKAAAQAKHVKAKRAAPRPARPQPNLMTQASTQFRMFKMKAISLLNTGIIYGGPIVGLYIIGAKCIPWGMFKKNTNA